jgi:peptidoglycan/LPS O-acetylase OafA/YrhL
MRREEIRSLTGLRGVAALLVVITHFWFWARVTPMAALPTDAAPWTRLSDIGMSIFFTLSGFVIALSYSHWDWRAQPLFCLTRLFAYRLARLYPAFLLFAVLIVLRNPSLRDLSEPAAQQYLWPHLALWQSWWPVKFGGVVAIEDHFNVSWSLSTECGLYVMFALGAILATTLPSWPSKGVTLAVVFFVATWELLNFCWVERSELAPPGWTDWDWGRWLFHISPLGVSLQFGIGVVAWRLSELRLSDRMMKFASNAGAAGLIALYVAVGTRLVVDKLDLALLASLATGCLMVGAAANTATNRALSGRAIVYLGTISYSVYLFHVFAPGVGFYAEVPVYDAAAKAYHALNALVTFAVTILIAHGAYYLVEVPGRRFIRRAADQLLGVQREGASPLHPVAPP